MDFMGFMEAMGTSNIPIIAAFFIGLMTAISPCPLASNIAAIAYTSRKMQSAKATLITGFLYTLGRVFTYTTIAVLIVWAGLSTRSISLALQQYGDIILGPLMIFAGVVMLEIVKLKLPSSGRMDSLKAKLAQKGYLGAFFLGAVFALAFCPFSAVLFFAMLIPIAMRAGDAIIIPSVFAFATGLPVIILSIILAKSVSKLASAVKKVQKAEAYMRKAVGVIFLVIGGYYLILVFA
ncbi:MAG: sulfite exporter TauE/SafE family protein [Candidatus Altiarchaeota archaeon]|nr:sulfite exporter TauE/SafE family protein [Candidatus Altiarchaeota archaeon]